MLSERPQFTILRSSDVLEASTAIICAAPSAFAIGLSYSSIVAVAETPKRRPRWMDEGRSAWCRPGRRRTTTCSVRGGGQWWGLAACLVWPFVQKRLRVQSSPTCQDVHTAATRQNRGRQVGHGQGSIFVIQELLVA